MYQGTVTVRFEAQTEEEAERIAQAIQAKVTDIGGVQGFDEDIWENK